MKTISLFSIALCVLLASCKKDNGTGQVYPVSAVINSYTAPTGDAFTLDSIQVTLSNSGGQTVAAAHPSRVGSTVELGNFAAGSYTIRCTAREITAYFVLGIPSYDTTHVSGLCTFTVPTQTGCDVTLAR